jgi:hypothetical protein
VRNNFAISVLTEIHKKNQQKTAIVEHRDDNYYFLADFVQSPDFNKIQHEYYTGYNSQDLIKTFSQSFLSNEKGWYQQLTAATVVSVITNENENNLFCQFVFHSRNCKDAQALLKGFLAAIDRLSEHYPQSLYSQSKMVSANFKPCENIVQPSDFALNKTDASLYF